MVHKENRKLVDLLIKEKLKLALVESVTCGLGAHLLSQVKGINEVLLGSVVCYDIGVKIKLLNVPKKMIIQHTAESQKVTDQLAKGLKKLIPAEICAAVTGLASEGGSETKQKPVGTVFYSIFYEGKLFRLRKRFRGKPGTIKKRACCELYTSIIKVVRN